MNSAENTSETEWCLSPKHNLQPDPDWLRMRYEISSAAKLVYSALATAEQAAYWGDGEYRFSRVLKERPRQLRKIGLKPKQIDDAVQELIAHRVIEMDPLQGRISFFDHPWRQENPPWRAQQDEEGEFVPDSDPWTVYFIQEGDDGLIKIGVTTNPERRRKALQTGSAQELRVLATKVGDVKVEAALHKRFKHLRVRGEWFRPEEELLTYIRTEGTTT